MKRIAVIGAGSWGTALAVMVQKHGHPTTLWARREGAILEMQRTRENKPYLPNIALPEALALTSNREEAVKGAEIIILAVPTKAVRQTVTDFAPYLNENQILVNVAKGLEQGSQKRLSVVIKECAPQCEVCVLSGPSHAEEVAKEIPTVCLIASEKEEMAKLVQSELMNKTFRLYTNTDMIGVEVAAALKNVMALVAGMSDGLGFGDNSKAAIMTRGITEMARLGVAMGGQTETFAGLSGVGDLIVTCTSMHSRNRRAGILLGQGKTLEETLAEIKMVVEGVYTAQVAQALAKEYGVEMPITQAVCEVVFAGRDIEEVVLELMSRDGKAE